MRRYTLTRKLAGAVLTGVPFVALALVIVLAGRGRTAQQDTQLVVVEAGDTLSQIAQRFGTTPEALVALNAIENPSRIYPNQVLLVPTKPDARLPQSPGQRVAALTQIPPGVPRRRWRYIVIHHSATSSDCARSINDYHLRVRGWSNGLGYHFVIGNGSRSRDGAIEVGPRWAKQQNGAHALSKNNRMNTIGIGICLVGNFNETQPTEAQMRSLVELVRRLQHRYSIPTRRVIGHRDVIEGYTECPGRHFSIERLRKML
jgi:N-acetylmuramoyl-L-alanine amidase